MRLGTIGNKPILRKYAKSTWANGENIYDYEFEYVVLTVFLLKLSVWTCQQIIKTDEQVI